MDFIKEVMYSYGIKPLPEKTAEAMAYVPFQPNGAETYSAVRGFESGTMYPALDKPFFGNACRGDKK